jgi:two-component system CheB/CheR fusion protein
MDDVITQEIIMIAEEFSDAIDKLIAAARERERGLGLGLSIVHRLGALLGHQVRVRSHPGRGL